MQPIDLNAFSEHLNSESDRACAVLGAALLDEKLKQVFRRKLSCFEGKLIDGMGPISNFSSRILLARALNWVSEEVKSDLDVVRRIRNDFAHNFDHNLSFSDDSVSDLCLNLRTAEALIDGYEVAAKAGDSNLTPAGLYAIQDVFKPPRWRYQLAVSFLAQYLDEVPEGVPPYTGSDIIAEIRSISANTRIEVSATVTVRPPAGEA